MKRYIIALVLLAASLGLCEQVLVTTTPVTITAPLRADGKPLYGPVKTVSVNNLELIGGNHVFARKNVTTNSFVAAYAWPVAPATGYASAITGSGSGRSADVLSITLATTNGTAWVDIAFDN